LDETSVSVDGASGSPGGRLSFNLFDPPNPNPGRQQNKASKSCTVIFAATDAGEMIPPHFQFCMKAKTDDGLSCWALASVTHFRNIILRMGFNEYSELPVTFGKNEK
jgi:hypothetical protein